METLASKLEETRVSVNSTLRSEGRRWEHFVAQRVARARSELAASLSLTALERSLLVRVDASLVALDGRVRARLDALSTKKTPKRARVARARKPATRASASASKGSGTALAA